jgi:hypothetical protein
MVCIHLMLGIPFGCPDVVPKLGTFVHHNVSDIRIMEALGATAF